jgi:hypothetical protein
MKTKATRTVKKDVSTKVPQEVVVPGESTAKAELIAYIENLKQKDVHEYAVREVELLKQLNKL